MRQICDNNLKINNLQGGAATFTFTASYNKKETADVLIVSLINNLLLSSFLSQNYLLKMEKDEQICRLWFVECEGAGILKNKKGPCGTFFLQRVCVRISTRPRDADNTSRKGIGKFLFFSPFISPHYSFFVL